MIKCFYPVSTAQGLRPCGQCAACLAQKQMQWKFRLTQEVLVSDAAFWLTLQYDDEHLPRSNGIPCVDKMDCQNYFRQIRKYIKRNNLKVTFKYFLTSEYGPKTFRPHYHVLMLFKLPGLAFKQMLSLRQELYTLCKERWYHGHVEEKLFHKGVVNYLTKYVFKPAANYDPPVQPFRLISQGIGIEYLEHCDRADLVTNHWRTPNGVLPRYYRDKLLPTSDPEFKDIRYQIFCDVLDDMYLNDRRELQKFGSLEAYERRQKYLLNCQKSQAERKQKLKYG